MTQAHSVLNRPLLLSMTTTRALVPTTRTRLLSNRVFTTRPLSTVPSLLRYVPTVGRFRVSSSFNTSSSCRLFSNANNDKDSNKDEEEEPQVLYTPEELQAGAMAPHRHLGIRVHPDSISKRVLPNNFVMKTTRRGTTKKRYTELVYGYFWMMKDLKLSNEKPILSNTKLIPSNQAKPLPDLTNLQSVSGQAIPNLRDYICRKNRSGDVHAQCTLVALSFRDYGYQLLPSWIDPFQDAFLQTKQDRVEITRINISEGWFNKWILKGVIQGLVKKNTPRDEQDSTFLYFEGKGTSGKNELEMFRDSLRLHNILTGYVFLLDGVGNVRFAGSGQATEPEVTHMVQCAKDILSTRTKSERKNKTIVKQKTRR